MVKKVLLVDDEKDFTEFMKASLETRGYTAIEAHNGVECGLYLASEKPDLIIMDIRMRGINGLDACRAIRKNTTTAYIPIFVVSALASDDDIEEGLGAGATKYFTKPLNLEDFLKEVTNLLQ
jgi:DNA-binding response OmpR family regulator